MRRTLGLTGRRPGARLRFTLPTGLSAAARFVGRWLFGLFLALAAHPAVGGAATAEQNHTVYLVPSADAVLSSMVTSAFALRDPVLLFDAEDHAAVRQAAAEWTGPRACFYRADTPPNAVALMESIAGRGCTRIDDLTAFARQLWPTPESVIAFPETDYESMLRAAALAPVVGAALWPVVDPARTPLRVDGWQPKAWYVSGRGWPGTSHSIDSMAAALQLLRTTGGESFQPPAVVIANPADRLGMFSPSRLSLIAPLVSAMHRAPLILVGDADPDAVERQVLQAIDDNDLGVGTIVLVGDELALRSHRIPDPVFEAGGPAARGGGKIVRVELFSEVQNDRPQDFAVGRIVADDTVHASLNLARRLHGPPPSHKRPVIFLANADKVFALGETISRTTVQDLQNVGVPVRTFYREEVTPEVSQQSLRQTDVLVWEGHPRDLTLEERGGVAVDTAPDVVVLQGCYTLDRSDPFILIEKGTQAIVATTAAVYSASGSALARALFDSLVNDRADLGTALRNARNYLLAIAHLKRERGHKDWRKSWRAAMAFALWGDPLMRLPLKAGKPTQAQAQWRLQEPAARPPSGPRKTAARPPRSDDTAALELDVPRARMRPIAVDDDRASIAPRARLSGILWRHPGEDRRWLRELYFSAITIPEEATRTISEGGSPEPTRGNSPEDIRVCPPDPQWGVTSLYAPRSRTLFVVALPEWEESNQKPGKQRVLFPLVSGANGCASTAD